MNGIKDSDIITIGFDPDDLDQFLKDIEMDAERLKYEGFKSDTIDNGVYRMLCYELSEYWLGKTQGKKGWIKNGKIVEIDYL